MADSNLYNEIVDYLQQQADTVGYTNISEKTAKEFFAGAKTQTPPQGAAPQAFSQPPRNTAPQAFNQSPQTMTAVPPAQPQVQQPAQQGPFGGGPRPQTPPSPPQQPSQQGPFSQQAFMDSAPQQAQQQVQQPPLNVSTMDHETLRMTAAQCTRCRLHQNRTNPVFCDGNPNADLMFIGEGPGYDEDKQGVPFVGKAGQLLTKMIMAMQFQRSDVYIANIVKCHPPKNRNPEEDEAAMCLPFLERQIELVQPKVIVLLGAVPLKYLLKMTGITRMHGQWQQYKGIKTMPTFHPAFLLRNVAAKKDAWDDLQKVMAEFGKYHTK